MRLHEERKRTGCLDPDRDLDHSVDQSSWLSQIWFVDEVAETVATSEAPAVFGGVEMEWL